MKVVLATGAMAPEPGGVPLTTAPGAPAPESVAAALADGWRTARPDDELVIAPLSDGSAGCAATLPADRVAGRRELAGTGPLGEPVTAVMVELAGSRGAARRTEQTGHVGRTEEPGPAGQAGQLGPSGQTEQPARTGGAAGTAGRAGTGGAARTWLLDAAGLLPLPADPELAARHAREGSSHGLGQVLAQALELTRPGDTLVVGLGRSAVHDGGAGMLQALGGPAGALACTRGREIVLALADTVALSGLSGAGQGLAEVTALTPEEAQELDRRAAGAASAALAAVAQARLDSDAGEQRGGAGAALAGGSLLPAVDGQRLTVSSWGTGGGGGSAAVLRALGGRALPGARVMADLTGLADQVSLEGGTDLVVTAAGEVYDVLADSVPAVVGELATRQALPAVLVCRQGLVPRGELAEAGLSAVYSLSDSAGSATAQGTFGATAWDGVVTALQDLGARLARTWSR